MANLSSQVKKFCAEKLGVNVRVRTIPSKAKWVQCWVPMERSGDNEMICRQSFPEPFRHKCLEIIYDTKFADEQRAKYKTTGGNVETCSISMRPDEWEQAMAQYAAPVDTAV
jgi:hypothetical protein